MTKIQIKYLETALKKQEIKLELTKFQKTTYLKQFPKQKIDFIQKQEKRQESQKQKTLLLNYTTYGNEKAIGIMALLSTAKGLKLKLLDQRANLVPKIHDLASGLNLKGHVEVLNLLGRLGGLTPADCFLSIQIEAWVFRAYRNYKSNQSDLKSLNDYLKLKTFVSGQTITTADIALWAVLQGQKNRFKDLKNILRYFSFLDHKFNHLKNRKKKNLKFFKESGKKDIRKKVTDQAKKIKIDLKWKGKIITRFPPEPSGYLHIGHIKALFLNYHTAKRMEGKMILRFDDTNPTTEKSDYENAILKDIKSMDIEFYKLTHTSDYFGLFQEYCEQAIKEGNFYIDPQSQAELKNERIERRESVYRNKPINDNLDQWHEMLEGKQGCSVRAKLNPFSDNGTLRDPVMYRVNLQPHHRTKTKFKVYPTYDFACPIIDSIEGITHVMRSKEYNTRNEQYIQLWNIVCKGKKYREKMLKLPEIFQFSRLDFVQTELSKRKINSMIKKKMAFSWDDPRLPTVQGILRRGMTRQALSRYIESQGGSTSDNRQEWDKIWAFNKKHIDPICGRYWCVGQNAVLLKLENVPERGEKIVNKVPKNKKFGEKILQISNRVLVDPSDLVQIQIGDKVTLTTWGNVQITEIKKAKNQQIVILKGKFLEKDKDFKKTLKLSWIADTTDKIEVRHIKLDHLLTKEYEGKNWEQFINPKTWFETNSFGESSMRFLKKGDHIQLIRKGYFIVEQPFLNSKNPLKLFNIPDGSKKD